MEKLVLTNPLAAASEFTIASVQLSRARALVRAVFVPNAAGEDRVLLLRGDAARALIRQLNAAVRDGTGKTLERHLFERALADGLFDDVAGGTIQSE